MLLIITQLIVLCQVEDLSDEMFAARHLRYEIYEKKQIQPLLSQRRRSRSTRSESEHSLTVSADPRSPDTVGGVGPEAAGEPVFATDEAPSDTAVSQLLEPSALPTVDVSLCRLSPSTLAAFTRPSWTDTEAGHLDTSTGTVAGDACKDSSWPVRSFPLVDNDYDKLQAADYDRVTSASVSAGLIASAGGSVPPAEPVVADDTDWTLVSPTDSLTSTLR